jgi:hypothetical protein
MTTPTDWVARRHHCSVDLVFYKLRDQVDEDVASRNALREERREQTFVFSVEKEKHAFTVIRRNASGMHGVRFVLIAPIIRVADLESDKPMFDATLTLDAAGECKLLVDGEELDFWRFRFKALEGLFFKL